MPRSATSGTGPTASSRRRSNVCSAPRCESGDLGLVEPTRREAGDRRAIEAGELDGGESTGEVRRLVAQGCVRVVGDGEDHLGHSLWRLRTGAARSHDRLLRLVERVQLGDAAVAAAAGVVAKLGGSRSWFDDARPDAE